MNKFRLTINVLAIAIFTFAFASIAQAQATRTWVSGVGDDANPCSRTAPCKTFAGAISKTAVNGEISVLDPGGFGAVTITKSITIDGTGTLAGILAAGLNGVTINIAVGADTKRQVRLRGLSINGANTGINGIRVVTNGATAVHVEDTVIDGFTSNGIDVNLATSSALKLRNVTIRNCASSGISTNQTGVGVTAIDFDNVNVSSCATGFSAANGTRGSIRGSTFGLNSSSGIATAQTTSATEVNIDASLITGNSIGINTFAGSKARIARCLISQNGNALGLAGLVDTGGNNTIMGNGTDQDPNGTLFTQK